MEVKMATKKKEKERETLGKTKISTKKTIYTAFEIKTCIALVTKRRKEMEKKTTTTLKKAMDKEKRLKAWTTLAKRMENSMQ